MSRRKWIAVVLSVLLGVAAIVWAFTASPVVVELATVRRGPFVQTINEDGVTRVRDRYLVTAPVSGMLLRPNVHAGDRLQRDQAIATIVPNPAQMLDARTRAELAARIEAAAARSARAAAMLRQAEAAALQAANDHKRFDDLSQRGFVSQTERERSALNLQLRGKDREAAQFEQDAAQHDLQQARAALRQSSSAGPSRPNNSWVVRAPIAGQVLRIVQESEGPIAIGGPIVELGDVARLEAKIDVLSTEAVEIAPQAFVELDAGAGLRLSGRVRLVEPAARTKVSALGVEEQRVDVLVDLLPNPATAQRVGDAYRVDARIEVAHENDVLTVPVAALFRTGTEWAVFKLDDTRVRLIKVSLGARGTDVAIVHAGLVAGDHVVIYPSDAVRDGVRVELRGGPS
jgi:HlyD family secretion protein